MIPAQRWQIQQLIAAKTANENTTSSATADMLDAEYATIIINSAAELNTNATGPTISVSHSDDSTASFTTVTADRATEDLTSAKQLVYHVNWLGKKRYLKVSITTPTATNEDIIGIGATLVKSRKDFGPSSTSDMVASTNDVVVLVS